MCHLFPYTFCRIDFFKLTINFAYGIYHFINVLCKIIIICFLAITVNFEQPTYSVDEDDGPAQPVLVLSNSSLMNITVRVRDNGNTATGK